MLVMLLYYCYLRMIIAFRSHQSTVIYNEDIQLAKANNSSEIQIIEFTLKKADFYHNQSVVTDYI